MKYMTLIYEHADEIGKDSEDKHKALIQQHNQLQKEAKEARAYIGAVELKPANSAISVRIQNAKPSVTDGPFAESKEVFVGFYIFDCADLDAALKWAGMIPTGPNGGVEVRPIDDDESCPSIQTKPDSYAGELNAGASMYALLIYQPEAVFDAYSAKELDELIQGNGAMAENAMASGHYVLGNKLLPPVTTTTILNRNAQHSITDGPFSEAKEVLLGLHIIACKSIEEVRAYAEQIPNANAGVVEVRPINFYEQDGEMPLQWTSST